MVAVEHYGGLRGLRDRAIIGVLLGCGLRRSEVAALTFAHIQQRDGRCTGGTGLATTLLFLATAPSISAQSDGPALIAKARAIHDRVLKLDTHNDIDPANFTAHCNYTMRLTTQVNLPKMIEGGMDVSFIIVYVGQGPLTLEGFANAYRLAIAKFDAIHRLTEQIARGARYMSLAHNGNRQFADSNTERDRSR